MNNASAQVTESHTETSNPNPHSSKNGEAKSVDNSLDETNKEKQVKKIEAENYQIGKWTKEEHTRFMDAFNTHGKNWKKIQECVETRTITQVRSHAQKCLPGANNSRRNTKDVNKAELPETTPKDILPKARKRVQNKKAGSSVKKVKANQERSLLKSEMCYDENVVLRSSEVLASSNIVYDAPYTSVYHYGTLPNESESRNDNQDFDFDFSEAEVKPLRLD